MIVEVPRIVFLGGRILGFRCLEMLGEYRDRVDVSFVMAHKRDGESGSDWNPPLLPRARELGFPVYEAQSLRTSEAVSRFRAARPDIILNPFCNRIIPREILDIPRLGTVNFHYGRLPRYRGRFIVTHVILNGETETCATAHFMTENVDEGDIVFEEPVPVLPDDTARDLYMRCTDAAVVLFGKVLDNVIAGGTLPRRAQVGDGSYYPYEEPNGCVLDPTWPAERQERFVRALTFPPVSAPLLKLGDRTYRIVQD